MTHQRTEDRQIEFDLLKRDLIHYLHTRGLKHMLEALIEIFEEWGTEHNEDYQFRLVKDLQRTLDRYEQRYQFRGSET